MPKVIKVIITDEYRGKGTVENPSRRVTVVYDLKGNFIAEHDQWAEEQKTP